MDYRDEELKPEDYFLLQKALDMKMQIGYLNEVYYNLIEGPEFNVVTLKSDILEKCMYCSNIQQFNEYILVTYKNKLYILNEISLLELVTSEFDTDILSIKPMYSSLDIWDRNGLTQLVFKSTLKGNNNIILGFSNKLIKLNVINQETVELPLPFSCSSLSVAHNDSFVIVYSKDTNKALILDINTLRIIKKIDECTGYVNYENPVGDDMDYKYFSALDFKIKCKAGSYYILADNIFNIKEYLEYYGLEIIGKATTLNINTKNVYYQVQTRNGEIGTMSYDLSKITIGAFQVICPKRHDLIIEDIRRWRDENAN